jgi:thioredoxin-like negative regulator of GroEL
VVRTPFLSPDVGATDEPSPTLETRLEVSDQQTHARVREEAWALFREGQYRAAIRTFETAISLQPADFEMRIGEIFSYLSVSGRRTAVALLEELVRRDENPFQHAIRMRERYGNVGDTQALQLQARQAIDDPNQNLEVTVLYVLVLWHLGLEDEALRAAESIARRALGKPYALWPEKMRAARRPAPSTP